MIDRTTWFSATAEHCIRWPDRPQVVLGPFGMTRENATTRGARRRDALEICHEASEQAGDWSRAAQRSAVLPGLPRPGGPD